MEVFDFRVSEKNESWLIHVTGYGPGLIEIVTTHRK